MMLFGSVARAQSAAQIQSVHDQATTMIRKLSSRTLTPGDTFLTWNPEPGGLTHTVATDAQSTSSSLLRGDGMIGTARMQWANQRPHRFDVEWTTRDSTTGQAKRSFAASGTLVGDSLRITGSQPSRRVRVPKGLWAVADFGMEECLIPLLRTLGPTLIVRSIAVFRPWHLSWDTVTVRIQDTASLRIAQVRGADKSNELIVLDAHGDLLSVIRLDLPGERRPLEGSRRYQDWLKQRALLNVLAARYAGK